MKKLFNKIVLIFLLFFFVFMVIFTAWAIWQRTRDPIKALDHGLFDIEVKRDYTYEFELETEKRYYSEMILYHKNVDSIRVTISFPQQIPSEGLPVLIILGGLEIGRESLKYIPQPGNNILIVYQYPYSPQYWYDGAKINQIPAIQRAVLIVPAQVEALARWTRYQPWSDKSRVSVSGYSFGAFFVPAVYHLAAVHDFDLGPGVIAYGGVDINQLLRHNMNFLSPVPRMLVAWVASTAIYPGEPASHLPHMKSDFLLINGRNDHQIPEESYNRLHQLTPEHKTVMILDTGHMHPRNPELTLRLVQLSRNWLVEKNAVNP